MRAWLLLLFSLPALSGACAQASSDCPIHPAGLAAMRNCYRPLLVFAPNAKDPRLVRQQAELDHAADDMMDRNVLYLPVLPSGASLIAPLDVPYARLPDAEWAALRRRFHVTPTTYEVILIGEDGSEKLRSGKPVSAETLNALIDSMPTRRREMQRPHSN